MTTIQMNAEPLLRDTSAHAALVWPHLIGLGAQPNQKHELVSDTLLTRLLAGTTLCGLALMGAISLAAL